MWAILNKTPFGAERNWSRDKAGFHWWIVAVKATYDIGPQGQLNLADEQSAPLLAPEYTGSPGASSMLYDSDLLLVKSTTDINVVSHPHAPGARAAAVVPVCLRVGKLEKQLLVYGDRFHDGRNLTSPKHFIQKRILYEFAFGGSDCSDPDPRKHRLDERNPIGRGFAIRPEDLQGRPAYSIEYADGDPAEKGPAGFGPIDPAWLPRRKLAGTYDAVWEKSKRPLLPDDYQLGFGQSSPTDQRAGKPLTARERVELGNLTPEGLLRFEVPAVRLKFTTHIARRKVAGEPTLTTVLIEPEFKRVAFVWQSSVRVAAPDADYLDVTEVEEQAGK